MKMNLSTHKALFEQQIARIKLKALHAKTEHQRQALEYKATVKRKELNQLWRKYLKV